MLENPCIELGEDRCKFYVAEIVDTKYGHCLIWARGNKPIKNVKDRFDNKITDAQIEWFNQNCIDYPSLEDMVAGHMPPEGCGFTIEVQT